MTKLGGVSRLHSQSYIFSYSNQYSNDYSSILYTIFYLLTKLYQFKFFIVIGTISLRQYIRAVYRGDVREMFSLVISVFSFSFHKFRINIFGHFRIDTILFDSLWPISLYWNLRFQIYDVEICRAIK